MRLKGKTLRYPMSIMEIARKMPFTGLGCALGVAMTPFKSDGPTYELYMRKRFGDYIYDMAFDGYARKVWGEPDKLDAELGRTRMSASNALALVIDSLKSKKSHSFDSFLYHSTGIGEFVDLLAEAAVEKGASLKNSVYDISIKEGLVSYARNGSKGRNFIAVDYIISTVPIADLNNIMDIDADVVSKFKSRDLNLHYYIFDRSKVDFSDTWMFFPEKNVIINRLSRNWSDKMVPEGKICICAEVTQEDANDTYVDIEVVDTLGVALSDIESVWTEKITGAYPICHVGFKDDVRKVFDEFASVDVFCIGRHACHNYNNMDHSIKEAIDLAELIRDGGRPSDWIDKMEEYRWKIID
jgi:protoporphyrinogen oxidase